MARTIIIWTTLACTILIPLVLAATSPLLQWREPIYIIAGFAGIIGLGLLLVQPLLIGGYLPKLSAPQYRKLHRLVGAMLVLVIIIHVAGLWVTSPPDVIDALLFRSPTPFSAWGVIAMWAVFLTVTIVIIRKKLRLSPKAWRFIHLTLAIIIIAGTIIHALLIQGTMENYSKIILCVLVAIALSKLIYDRLIRAS